MPKYDVDVNGRTYEVDAPDPNTAWAWANQFVAAQEATRAARPGFFDAAGRGLESATLGGIRGLQMTAQPDNLALEQRMLESRGPSFTWEDVKSEFKAGDYGRGLSELWGLTKQSTGESLGFMAPALVTGKAAAALTPPVLPVVGPLAKPIAGALGTVAGLLPGMYGTNVERQAGEREAARRAGTPVPEWEFGKAATAAAGQTALDLITLRASGLHRVAGMGREEALAVARRELQELGAEGFARSLGVGTLRTMAAEVPTEITQQGLERWQAGLPLTGEDAMKEYEASAVGAALSSPVFGAVGRRVEVGQARRQEAALVAKEQQAQQQRAAAQAALQARQDAFNALSPGTQQEMPLTQFEGPMRPSGDFTPPTPESFTQERTNTANRLMNMQAEIDRLRQEGRIGEAAALKERYFQEEAKFNEMGGVTPGQLSKLRNDVAQTQEKLTKGQERLLSAQTKEEYDNISKGLGKQQERLDQLTTQLQQAETLNAYTSQETGGAQLQLDMERNEQAERIQAAIQSGNEYILGYDEVNALGVPRTGGAKRRISLLDLTQPEARVEARKIVEESAKNAEAKARFLQMLDRIDADIARAKEQATAAPTTSELQVDEAQQGVDFEATAAQEQAVDGITSAELEPEQQADPEYEAFLRERARQQAERVKSPAQRAAEAREAQMKAEGRWTDADEQRAREEEAMWAAQRQQEIEATPYGTQFELTAPGSMPVSSQQRQQEVEQVPPTMRDLATQYIAARNEKNAELMQAIETTAKSINPEQWKKTKYEYLTSGRKQAKLDFEGAAQPVPGDTRAGGQADVQRPAAEPSVGVPVQPEQPAAAQVEEPAGPGVGDVERPAGRRDAPEKPKRRTLKEKRDAVQEQKPDEGVLRREEPEMGLQEVGEGDAKPQEAAQEGKGEAEVDRAQLVKDLQDVSSKEGNSSAGQRARKYLLEARNGTGSPKEASDFVADYRIAAARAPKPKRVSAVQAPQPPKQKTIADYEAELDAEYERDDGPRQAVVTALENKIAAMQRGAGTVAKGVAADVAEAEDGSFSGSTDKPSGTTVAKVVSAIKRAFFNPSNFDNKVTVAQSVNDLPPAIARKFKEAEAKGLYGSAYFDGRRVYIVADQTPESDILGVVLHDVGVHMGMKNLLGEELYKQLLNQIEKWAKPGTGLEHQIAARALARAGVNEKAGVASNDEVLAYFVEEAVAAGVNPTALKGTSPLTQWFRKLWAAAKAAIRRLGINPDKLTAQDVVDMAYGAARMELAGTWHGTAADFRKFNHAYMGTGEGAQAFGWGTYLAQRFGIGKGYWEADIKRKQGNLGGDTNGYLVGEKKVTYSDGDSTDKQNEYLAADVIYTLRSQGMSWGDVKATAERYVKAARRDSRADVPAYELAVSMAERKQEVKVADMPEGSLMRVDTNIQDDELLDWDKPLSEQSEYVQRALLIKKFLTLPKRSGESLYHQLEREKGSAKAASEYLDSIGIKGIKFLDRVSRLQDYTYEVSQADETTWEVKERSDRGFEDNWFFGSKAEADKFAAKKEMEHQAKKTRNLVIFNDKNIQRVFTDVGAKETQRSFSGRATNAKAQAERILADVGRTADMAAPSTMQERVRAITDGVKEPKALGKRAFDWVMTQLDSAYPAQEKLRDAMTADQRAMHEYAVAYGMFAQAGHLNGVAGMALQEGGVSFDPNTGHFVARESGNSGRRLHDLQVEMAKTHGMSYEDARRYTIQAWEGRRTLSLYRERDQRLKDANELEAAGKKKQAAAIRDKWEGMKFHITRDAATKLDSLYQVFPELGEITKVKNGMRKWIMDFVVDSGLLSKEKAELLLDNADWVPFKREFDPDETGSMEQFAMAREAFQPSMMRGRAFRGSERSVTDIMDSFDSWALYMMRTAMRNQATKASVAEFMRYGAAKPTSQTKSAGTENRRVRYFADGKPQYVLFDDAPIAAFFNSNIASPRQSAIMAGFNAIFRKSIIGMPTFSLKQLIVDSQEAIIKSGLPAKYAIQIPKLATQEFIKLRSGAATEAHKALTKRGFAGAYTDIAAVRGEELRTVLGYHVTDDKQRSKFMQKWKDAETYGMHMAMHSDNAVRQAIYIAAKDSGMSEAQALNAAADYVNFKRTLSNDTLRAVAAYVPFLTASLSAIRASLMALSGKGITPQERGAALKNYATNMAIVTALSTLWAMANSDDEEYNNMSPEQRARQWTLPGTGGFGIPRRVSVESVVPILSELAVNQMTDKAVDATRMRKATFGLLGEALMPIPEPVPAPVKVLVEQVTNYNSFTGDPVVGTTLNKQDAWKQYGANTSAAARAVGEGMESVGLGNFWFASPTRIDHITRGLLGSVGASGLLLSNMIASKAGDRPEMSTKDLLASIPGFSIPAAKEFNQSDRNDFYDLAERLDKVASTANALLSEGRVEEYQDYVEKNRDKLAMDKAVGRMMDQLNKIRRATKMVRESSMPGRDDEIRRLREVEMRLIQNLNVKGLRVAAGM